MIYACVTGETDMKRDRQTWRHEDRHTWREMEMHGATDEKDRLYGIAYSCLCIFMCMCTAYVRHIWHHTSRVIICCSKAFSRSKGFKWVHVCEYAYVCVQRMCVIYDIIHQGWLSAARRPSRDLRDPNECMYVSMHIYVYGIQMIQGMAQQMRKIACME